MVTKRDGSLKPVSFDKITERIAKLCYDLNPEYIDPVKISQKVISGVFNGVTTEQLDRLAAETGASPRAAANARRDAHHVSAPPSPPLPGPRAHPARLPLRRDITPPQPRTRRRAIRTLTRSRPVSRSRTSRR